MTEILKYSQLTKHEFPLVVKMFELSVLCLVLLRTGKLYSWANKSSESLIDVMNQAYSGLFLYFMSIYILGRHTIDTIGEVGLMVEKEAKSKGVLKTIEPFLMESD